MEQEQEKPTTNRRNVILMVILIIMFLIGIFLRREYISKEISDTIKMYKERIITP